MQDGVDAREVEPAASDALMDTTLAVGGSGYCYLRVELEDDELAWTSPIFFAAT